MPDYLFPNFLRDPAEYKAAEAFWLQQWNDLISQPGESQHWQTHWLNTTYANGEPFMDGNPIFSAISSSRNLAVRIIQVEGTSHPQEFGLWTDTFGDDDDSVNELVIACVLTLENIAHAKDLLHEWITTGKIRDLLQFRDAD